MFNIIYTNSKAIITNIRMKRDEMTIINRSKTFILISATSLVVESYESAALQISCMEFFYIG